MTLHPLDGPLLRCRCTERELKRFRRLESRFFRENIYRVEKAEINSRTGKQIYRYRIDREPPLYWGVLIGEVAHNLRAALDGLVYQLVQLNGHTPTRRNQFPICLYRRGEHRGPDGEFLHSFEGKERGSGRDMLQGVKPCHQTMIERLQPYHDGPRRKRNSLWLLSEVNNADKC